MLIDYHRSLLGDKTRNDAFYRALKKIVKKGETVVADIGSGTGLLGFMASRLGAKEVYLYEYADVMNLSFKIAKTSKIKNCRFIHEHSTDIADPPPVDLVISETLGNYALEEHIIATVEDAKRFLKPGGTIIPNKITQFVCPVTSGKFYKELSVWDDVGYGLDYKAAKTMSLNNIYVRRFKPADLLDGGKGAQAWDNVDFSRTNESDRKGKAQWTLKKNTEIYGFAVWWACDLIPGVALSTGPLAPKTHWEQLYFPVLEPLEARKGDTLTVGIESDTSYEEGTVVRWRASLKKSSGGAAKNQSLDLTKGYLG